MPLDEGAAADAIRTMDCEEPARPRRGVRGSVFESWAWRDDARFLARGRTPLIDFSSGSIRVSPDGRTPQRTFHPPECTAI